MPHEFLLPDIGEGLTDAEIVEWHVAEGDEVLVDQAIVDIETAKITVEITSIHSGIVLKLGGLPGATINVGDVLFVIGEKGDKVPRSEDGHGNEVEHPSAFSRQPSAKKTGHADPAGRVRTMPIVRKLARDNGVDLETIDGTGPGGTVTREDVERAVRSESGETLTSLTRIRKAIARHMTESWTTIPHVTVQADIRAENLLAARRDSNEHPIPLEAIIGVAVLPLLARYREFNASMHHDVVEFKDRFNLGFAVDTKAGLMVVVVKKADRLTLKELASEIDRLATSAVAGTLTPEEVTGQTFTISNIGALGGGHGTPIIPLGTSAILSIGRAMETAVVERGEVTVGMVAPIDLSYDHRLIDGGLGQRFLSDLIDSLER
ncbi:MAG: dihydrolipoamide acetyltransferase family protein [Acidimicrobiia bacterium]